MKCLPVCLTGVLWCFTWGPASIGTAPLPHRLRILSAVMLWRSRLASDEASVMSSALSGVGGAHSRVVTHAPRRLPQAGLGLRSALKLRCQTLRTGITVAPLLHFQLCSSPERHVRWQYKQQHPVIGPLAG